MKEMFTKIKIFQIKFRLWELQLWSNNKSHFPPLRKGKPTGSKKYVEEIKILKQEFIFRFQDFQLGARVIRYAMTEDTIEKL
jgi:hypothetical protein